MIFKLGSFLDKSTAQENMRSLNYYQQD